MFVIPKEIYFAKFYNDVMPFLVGMNEYTNCCECCTIYILKTNQTFHISLSSSFGNYFLITSPTDDRLMETRDLLFHILQAMKRRKT